MYQKQLPYYIFFSWHFIVIFFSFFFTFKYCWSPPFLFQPLSVYMYKLIRWKLLLWAYFLTCLQGVSAQLLYLHQGTGRHRRRQFTPHNESFLMKNLLCRLQNILLKAEDFWPSPAYSIIEKFQAQASHLSTSSLCKSLWKFFINRPLTR